MLVSALGQLDIQMKEVSYIMKNIRGIPSCLGTFVSHKR